MFGLGLAAACGGERPVAAPVATVTPTSTATVPEPPALTRKLVDAATLVHRSPRFTIIVNMGAVRRHALSAAARSMLTHMAPWQELGASIDPVSDTDWLVYSGPKFYANGESMFLLHYSAPEARMDSAIAAMPPVEEDGKPRPIDVPKVRGTLATVDKYPRWLLRAEPRLLAIVPVAMGDRAARALVGAELDPGILPDEAVKIRFRRPGRDMPFGAGPSVHEVRAWLVGKDDGGAEFFGEADCAIPSEAVVVSNEVRSTLQTIKGSGPANLKTMFDHVEVTAEGTVARLRVPATKLELEALLTLIEGLFGAGAP